MSGRLDESADRATRLASRGCAEHAFTGWLSADGARGRGGQDSTAPAASSASEVALARTLVRDPLRAPSVSACAPEPRFPAGPEPSPPVPPPPLPGAGAAGPPTGPVAGASVGNRHLDRLRHVRRRRCRRKRRNLGNFRKWRKWGNWRNLRNLNWWKLRKWRKLCRGSRAARRHTNVSMRMIDP